MVMSGTDERVVFVHARPGDEVLLTGGTIARLRAGGATVVVAYAASTDLTRPEAARALAALDVTEWRMLPAASGADATPTEANLRARESALRILLADLPATALVIGEVDAELLDVAGRVGQDAGVPVFLSRRVSEAHGGRLTAIDVSDHVDEKLRALAAYPERWRVEHHSLELPDGSLLAISGAETYVRLDPPRALPRRRAGLVRRFLAGILALILGVGFAALGTIAHQATIVLGTVELPVGLIIALLAACSLLLGLRLVLRDRLVVGLCAAGMLGTIFVMSLRGTGGSVLVPEGVLGTVWTLGPAVVAALVLAWPQIPARRRSA